jgi:hypothetical protein
VLKIPTPGHIHITSPQTADGNFHLHFLKGTTFFRMSHFVENLKTNFPRYGVFMQLYTQEDMIITNQGI